MGGGEYYGALRKGKIGREQYVEVVVKMETEKKKKKKKKR